MSWLGQVATVGSGGPGRVSIHQGVSGAQGSNIMDQILCLPKNSYAEILTLNMMIFGGGAFERWLGLENGTIMNTICAL